MKPIDSRIELRDAHDRERDDVGHEELHRREERGGEDRQPHEPQRTRGIATVEAVVVLPDERQHEQHADAADGAEHAPVEGVGAVVVLHEEVGEHGEGEQPEAQRRERDDDGLERPDLPEPRERGLDRDRRRLRVLDDLAEDILLLELAARRLLQLEREERHDRDREAEQHERPAPAVVAAGSRGDAGDDDRAEHADEARPHGQPGVDAPARADRVGVADHRSLHRVGVRLRHADTEPGPEQLERVGDRTTEREEARERQVGPADDRWTAVSVGQPAHGQRAEHQERARCRGEEHDRPVAHPERVAQVGGEHRQRRRLELLQRAQEHEHDERADPADAHRLAERDLLLPHPGKEVGGEQHLLLRRGLLRLALGLGVEDRYRELRRLAGCGGRRSTVVHVTRSSCRSPAAA